MANLRDSYVTRCRFFRDSDQEVEIKWVPAQPGALMSPQPTPFSSQRWKAYPHLLGGVGEVFGADVTVVRPVPIAGADGTGQCGEDRDFQEGGVWDPDLPPTEYTPEGLALCCGPDPGGIEVGGSEDAPPEPAAYEITAGFFGGFGILLTHTSRGFWRYTPSDPPIFRLWGPAYWAGFGWGFKQTYTSVGPDAYAIGWDGTGSGDFYTDPTDPLTYWNTMTAHP